MKIYIEEADGTQRAPLILVDLDDAHGPRPLQQVLQSLLAEMTALKDRLDATHPRA